MSGRIACAYGVMALALICAGCVTKTSLLSDNRTPLAGCMTPAALQPVAGADPDAPENRVYELLAKLDYDPDILHFDYTPAVRELIEIGEPAIEPTLPYLLSENWGTRLHAERVIGGAIARMHGFVSGRGWSRPEDEQECKRFYGTLWNSGTIRLKSLDESPVSDRIVFIERVKQWLASRRASLPPVAQTATPVAAPDPAK